MVALKMGMERAGAGQERPGTHMRVRSTGEMTMNLRESNAVLQRSRGFTLIELVVTISVIAILAAVALPRYITLQTQARAAKAQALYGGARSAAALAHAMTIATNTTTSGAATIQMEAQNVTLINGYPTADAAGIQTAMQIANATEAVNITVGGAGAGSTLTIDINGGTVPNCRVSYTSPAVASGSPTVVVDDSGC